MINKYSYGHLMILEISSDQQMRPAGLIKRETGVNPVRSRHCNGESSDKIPLAGCVRNRAGKVSEGEEPESGDLLVIVLR